MNAMVRFRCCLLATVAFTGSLGLFARADEPPPYPYELPDWYAATEQRFGERRVSLRFHPKTTIREAIEEFASAVGLEASFEADIVERPHVLDRRARLQRGSPRGHDQGRLSNQQPVDHHATTSEWPR